MINSVARLQRKRENGEGGFTLIELLVVVVIIGVLVAIAVPLYLNYRKGANDKAAQSDVRGAISSIEQCNADAGSYPTAINGTGTAACKVGKSDSTSTFEYSVSNGVYRVYAASSSGTSGRWYCYASDQAGGVKAVTSQPGTGVTC